MSTSAGAKACLGARTAKNAGLRLLTTRHPRRQGVERAMLMPTTLVARRLWSSRRGTGATATTLQKTTTTTSLLTRTSLPSLIQASSSKLSNSSKPTAVQSRRNSFISASTTDNQHRMTMETFEPIPLVQANTQMQRPYPSALTLPRPALVQRPTTCPPISSGSPTSPSLQSAPPNASVNTYQPQPRTQTQSQCLLSPSYQFCNRRRPIPNSYWATPYLVACVSLSILLPSRMSC